MLKKFYCNTLRVLLCLYTFETAESKSKISEVYIVMFRTPAFFLNRFKRVRCKPKCPIHYFCKAVFNLINFKASLVNKGTMATHYRQQTDQF